MEYAQNLPKSILAIDEGVYAETPSVSVVGRNFLPEVRDNNISSYILNSNVSPLFFFKTIKEVDDVNQDKSNLIYDLLVKDSNHIYKIGTFGSVTETVKNAWVSPDRSVVVISLGDRLISVDTFTGIQSKLYSAKEKVLGGAAFSSDSKSIVFIDGNFEKTTLVVIDLQTGKDRQIEVSSDSGPIQTVAGWYEDSIYVSSLKPMGVCVAPTSDVYNLSTNKLSYNEKKSADGVFIVNGGYFQVHTSKELAPEALRGKGEGMCPDLGTTFSSEVEILKAGEKSPFKIMARDGYYVDVLAVSPDGDTVLYSTAKTPEVIESTQKRPMDLTYHVVTLSGSTSAQVVSPTEILAEWNMLGLSLDSGSVYNSNVEWIIGTAIQYVW